MKIAVMKETFEGEMRVPLIPPTIDKLVKLGAEVEIESGMGATCRYEDADISRSITDQTVPSFAMDVQLTPGGL